MVTDEFDSLLAEVRAHLEWEAARGHAGIAYQPASTTPAAAARAPSLGNPSPQRSAPTGAPQSHAPQSHAPQSHAPTSGGIPEEAMAIIQGLRGGKPMGSPKPKSAPVAAVVESSAETTAPLPARPAGGDKSRLAVLANEIKSCTRCGLHAGRTQTVFARGNPSAEVLFVGEGPGLNEDQQGEPFVGQAGQLLDKMIEAMGLGRDGVYVCNVVKCRPPENRTPLPDESAQCMPYLREQIGIVGPRIIVALGRCASENLGCALPGRSWRGVWGTFEGTPVMPTYHPAYLLRSPEMKRPVWEDLQKVMQRLRA